VTGKNLNPAIERNHRIALAANAAPLTSDMSASAGPGQARADFPLLPQGVCWFCAERGHSRTDRDRNVTCPYLLKYIQGNILTINEKGSPLWVGSRGGPRYDGVRTPL
jgi:hypothetical protein